MRDLLSGDPLPWFEFETRANPAFKVDTLGGYCWALMFPGEPERNDFAHFWNMISDISKRIPARQSVIVVAVPDPEMIGHQLNTGNSSIVPFRDPDGRIAGILGLSESDNFHAPKVLSTVVVDRTIRVSEVVRGGSLDHHLQRILGAFSRMLSEPSGSTACRSATPVLSLPQVFPPSLCQALIDYYRARGGQDSGFMREENGLTVGRIDHKFKRRHDCLLEDETLRRACRAAIERRVVPMMERFFQFRPTYLERYLVARYSMDHGFFRPHRDNTTKGTAHRRFALTINLNAHEYDGGDLRFPEFGPTLYRAETGGAIVFSCSLMHEVTPVNRGERFCFVPFLYDDAAAQTREKNRAYVAARAFDSAGR